MLAFNSKRLIYSFFPKFSKSKAFPFLRAGLCTTVRVELRSPPRVGEPKESNTVARGYKYIHVCDSNNSTVGSLRLASKGFLMETWNKYTSSKHAALALRWL